MVSERPVRVPLSGEVRRGHVTSEEPGLGTSGPEWVLVKSL